jgi:solute carrier family 25 phosphate transporter 3
MQPPPLHRPLNRPMHPPPHQQYEYFKKTYADYVGEDNMKNYGTFVYLAGSASAEFFADIALSPFEAVKVAVQTRPGFAKGLTDGMPKLIAEGGVGGLYKSLVPLWGRQVGSLDGVSFP